MPVMEFKGRSFYDEVVIANNPFLPKPVNFQTSRESAVDFKHAKSFVEKYLPFDTKCINTSEVAFNAGNWKDLGNIVKCSSTDILIMEKYIG